MRTQWLLLVVLVSGCATSPGGTSPVGTTHDRLAQVAPGVDILPGVFTEGTQPDGNTVLLEGSDGIIVVDTGRHQSHTREILDVVESRGTPLRAIINTHWHLDHVGGNVLLRQEVPDVRVFASSEIERANEGFLATYARQIEENMPSFDEKQRQAYGVELELVRKRALMTPTDPVTRSGPVEMAGRRLDLMLERNAVSGGDLVVLDLETRTLITGDLVTLPVPLLDTACVAGWSEALARLLSLPFDRAIPGHGRVLDRREVGRYRDAVVSLLECGSTEASDETCSTGWIRDTRGLYQDDEAFVRRYLAYYLSNHIRQQKPGLCEGDAGTGAA